MDSQSRDSFLEGLKGKYAGIVGIYRHNSSSNRIGIFDSTLVSHFPDSLKWIAHNGAGYDQIDVAACKAKGLVTIFQSKIYITKLTSSYTRFLGITVSNTPGAVDEGTATTALYLLVSSLRQFSIAERNARSGLWKKDLAPAHDPSSRTLGILGLGGIGLHTARLAHAFPMKKIYYYSRKPSPNAPEWIEYCNSMEDLLRKSDVLSLHIPLKAETEGLIGEKEIRTLKKGSVIINTARGKVIDEDALIRALKDGHVSFFSTPFYQLPNFLCSSTQQDSMFIQMSLRLTQLFSSSETSPYYLIWEPKLKNLREASVSRIPIAGQY